MLPARHDDDDIFVRTKIDMFLSDEKEQSIISCMCTRSEI